MNCEDVRRALLEQDWDESDRQRFRDALQHADDCESCQTALADFDRLRTAVRPTEFESEPQGGWEAFDDRLTSRVLGGRRRWPVMPIALAASVVLGVAGWGLHFRDRSEPGRAIGIENGNGMIVRALTPAEIEERMQVFGQVSDVFDQRAGWVLIGDQASDLGLRETPAPSISELLLLRLNVFRERALVSTADLVIVPGQVAELTVPSSSGPQVRYRVATGESRLNHVQFHVELAKPEQPQAAMASLTSDLSLVPGEVVSAGEMLTASGRYRVKIGTYLTDVPERGL